MTGGEWGLTSRLPQAFERSRDNAAISCFEASHFGCLVFLDDSLVGGNPELLSAKGFGLYRLELKFLKFVLLSQPIVPLRTHTLFKI